MTRYVTIAVALLLFVFSAFTTNLRASSDLGVMAQSATYDPVKQEIAIRFYNSTRHDVTAYNYSLRIDYADGTSGLEDRSSELAVDPTYTGFFLRAGNTRDEKLYDPQTKQVSRVVGIVDVVVYDDGTADVVNEAAFNQLVQSRKARVVAWQKLSETLKRSFPSDNSGQEAAKKLHELLKAYMDKGPNLDAQDSAMLDEIQMAIHSLDQPQFGPLTSERLHEYIKRRDEGLPAIKFHSELRRIN